MTNVSNQIIIYVLFITCNKILNVLVLFNFTYTCNLEN